VGQKHEKFPEFLTPFPQRDIRRNPRSMYARVPQAMAQFVLRIELLSISWGQPQYLKWRALTVSVPDYGSWPYPIFLEAWLRIGRKSYDDTPCSYVTRAREIFQMALKLNFVL